MYPPWRPSSSALFPNNWLSAARSCRATWRSTAAGTSPSSETPRGSKSPASEVHLQARVGLKSHVWMDLGYEELPSLSIHVTLKRGSAPKHHEKLTHNLRNSSCLFIQCSNLESLNFYSSFNQWQLNIKVIRILLPAQNNMRGCHSFASLAFTSIAWQILT